MNDNIINDEILEELKSVLEDDEIKLKEPLSKHTTYKIGGLCDCFVMPKTVEKIKTCIEIARKNNIPFVILGRGSNVLAADEGYRGIVIHLGSNFSETEVDGDEITAQAGASIIAVAHKAAENSLQGFEFICGVPGTVGGAVVINAGCYGSEVANVLVSAIVLDKNGDIKSYKKEDLRMTYRHTILMDEEMTLLSATFKLEKGDSDEIKLKMNELNERRQKVQPLNYPNCGSVFKRPDGCFPGKLVEDAGFKGKQIGGAQVSEMHANFIVNKGGAKASEVMQLVKMIRKKVKEEQNIELELEIRLLGNFDEYKIFEEE